MVKYFSNNTDIQNAWEHVVSAFWRRYPNPFSTHVLTEDVVYREVTADHKLLSRRLLTKTNRLPRWAEKVFPTHLARSVYIVEDSIVDPLTRSLTTFTWNLNHTTLMAVEERCVFKESALQPATTSVKREAWISSGIWIGTLQEQPDQVHEGAGACAVKRTWRGCPATTQGPSEGAVGEGQGGGQDPGLSAPHQQASAIHLTPTHTHTYTSHTPGLKKLHFYVNIYRSQLNIQYNVLYTLYCIQCISC
ncbi:PRELI domain-containing protein 1, mitochondrial isoform X1 [Gadus morhua]|uniref:PRELI domain-containing protein 1, mitochondrial isoform X1 n=1 Tax=Gadus morhua TaxID=8049 RepID=UPI0011B3D524|nr:PRELI domain-containing protein 1, mitochondrial-like isoform X1 [Gadus morhua]